MGFSSLGYVAIETTDVAAWCHFAENVLGLKAGNASPGGNVHLQMDERPFRIILVPGDCERFLLAGWECADQAGYEATITRLKQAGVGVVPCNASEAERRCVKALARTVDPDGNALEIYYGRVYTYDPFVSPQRVSGFVTGDMGMGHIVLPTPSLSKCHLFYTDLLGFEESDYMDVELAPGVAPKGLHFLHCDNPRHHSLALFETEHPAGLVHMMLEAKSVDDVGYALDRCLANDVHITASLGRHTNDRMVSFYMRCPSGFEIEYGCDGWQVDWDSHVPTISRRQSFWGHKFTFP